MSRIFVIKISLFCIETVLSVMVSPTLCFVEKWVNLALFLFIVLYQPDSGCILQEILYTDGTPVASTNIVFPSAYLNNEKIIHWNKMLTNSYIQI